MSKMRRAACVVPVLLPLLLLPSALSATAVLEEWVSRVDCPLGDGFLNDLIVDDAGNVILIGECRSDGESDFFTVKIDPDGELLWSRLYDHGPDDWFSAGAVDGSGNIYVSGTSWDSYTFYDFVTIGYAPDGAVLWVDRYDHERAMDFLDGNRSLAVDSSGNVYVTGSSIGSTYSEVATIKYAPDGEREWVSRKAVPGNQPMDIAVTGAGSVYVATDWYEEGVLTDILTIKYDADGNELWWRRCPGAVEALEVDSAGDVYLLGLRNYGTIQSFLTIKYSRDGEELWVEERQSSSYDWPRAIALDPSGGVYVAGKTAPDPYTGHFLTINYDAAGNEQWAKVWDCDNDSAYDMATDEQGNVYVTGTTNCDTGSYHLVTVKYDAAGNEEWVEHLDDVSRRPQVAVDKRENVYVAGVSGDFGTGADVVTVKYDGYTVQIMEKVIGFYEGWIADGLLSGLGASERAAAAHERIFADMLDDVYDLLAAGDRESACSTLDKLLVRVDGRLSPPDLVGGTAASTMHGMLMMIVDELGC